VSASIEMKLSDNQKARDIIRSNRYMTLATSAHGETWVAPVAYACDEVFNFYWYSEKGAKHSLHILANRIIAVAIFDSQASSDEVDGLQMLGQASEVPADELSTVADLYYQQSFPDPEDRRRWRKPLRCFEGEALQRFYRFKPELVYKCDLENTAVDRRILVDLKSC
jgi:uncharacterized protein YhbP (UPF0306 family)